MSLLRPRREARSISYQDVFGSGGDWSAQREGPGVTLPAVYACARLIAGAVASMPIRVFRDVGDGTGQLVRTPPLFRFPSRRETPYEWKHRCVTSLVLRGNTFGLPTGASTGGFPAQVHWLDNDLVTVNDAMYPDVAAEYWYRAKHLMDDEIVHLAAFTEPGTVRGLSPIAVFKRTYEAGLAAQDYGVKWFRTGGQPSGVLETDQKLKDGDAATLRARWTETRQSGGIAVLGQGAAYKAVQVAAEEAQFLEAQKFSATQVARIFGVPPEMIGADAGNSMTYSNREQRAIDFVTFTLAPYVTAIEEHLTRLVPDPLFVRLNADKLLTSDLKSRFEANAIGIASHQLTPDEARHGEGRQPLTEEQHHELEVVPLTITALGKPRMKPAAGAPAADGTDDSDTKAAAA